MKYYIVTMVYYNQKFLVRAENKHRAEHKCIKALMEKGKGMFYAGRDFDVREARPPRYEMKGDVVWL